MDLSEYLRAGLKELRNKSTMESLRNSSQQQVKRRRSLRNENLMNIRKINQATLSPITPAKPKTPSKRKNTEISNDQLSIKIQPVAEKQPEMIKKEERNCDKRRMLLLQWKEDKKKRLEKEKKQKKPVFKVFHCSELPPIGKDNQPIKKNHVTPKSKGITPVVKNFAPENHVFRPPKNIKPINFNENTQMRKSSQRKLTFQTNIDDKGNRPKIKSMTTVNLVADSKMNNQSTKNNSLKCLQSSKVTTTTKKTEGKSKAEANNQKIINKTLSKPVTKKNPVQPSSRILRSANLQSTPLKINLLIAENDDGPKNIKTHQTKVLEEAKKKTKSTSNKKTQKTTKTENVDPTKKELTRGKLSSKNIETRFKKTSKKTEKETTPTSTETTEKIGEEIMENTEKEEPNILDKSEEAGNNSINMKTPSKVNASPIYISPFVTLSRGKDNARKEFKVRLSKGGTFQSFDSSKYTSPKAAASYFRQMLNQEVSDIRLKCSKWELIKTEQDIPEGAVDMINVATGMAHLLIEQKLEQFKNLIKSAETDKKVSCHDLHGFWDLVSIQIKNVNERFENLNKLMENEWEEILCPKDKTPMKKTTKIVKKTKGNSKIKGFIQAARQKKAISSKKVITPGKDTMTKFDVSFVKEDVKCTPDLNMNRKSSSDVYLSCSSTPCNTTNKNNSAIKSILKSHSTQRFEIGSKAVLFHNDEEIESDFENAQEFPIEKRRTLRRSIRLSSKIIHTPK